MTEFTAHGGVHNAEEGFKGRMSRAFEEILSPLITVLGVVVGVYGGSSVLQLWSRSVQENSKLVTKPLPHHRLHERA